MWNKTEVKPTGTIRVAIRNPKSGKKFSLEFVVVRESLTPLIGARAAQQMKLITIHRDNFVAVTAPKRDKPKVNQLLTVEEIVNQYPEVFHSQLGNLPGTVKLEVEKDARPVVVPTRRVPIALKEQFKGELDRLEELGVIAKVDKPTPWVSSVVVATKKSGQLRVCIDPKPLNAALKREQYHLPVLDDLLPELAKAKVFSTVDLRAGYWHCVLEEDSSFLTTFATPYGRYRWRRLPFGLSVSSEIFQKRVHQVLDGLDGILDITDDILIYGVGATEEDANVDHDRKLRHLLERCKKNGVALNPDKMKLRQKEVTYMGHLFTSGGLKVDPGKLEAVKELPRPTDIESVQRLNGFVNYLAKFLPRLADVMEPICRLTRKGVEWRWEEEQEKAFQEVKKLVTEAPVLKYYDPKDEVVIQCDASQKGLGATLLQQGRPVVYISRALTETEQRYAQIEKEMLAIVFSLERLNQYVFGRHVKIQSDHKPLEAILRKPLASAPRRLQGMMMRLQKYDFEVRYQQGTSMYIADMLSRAFLPTTEHPSGVEFECVNMASFLPISSEKMRDIQAATDEDESLQLLKKTIMEGWPQEKKYLAAQILPYFSMRDELTVQDGLLFKGQRVIIPSRLRRDMKKKIHASHLGTESCLRRASVYWPGMSAEIKELVASCEVCRTYETAQQKETLMPNEIQSRPWEQVGVDLFTFDKKDYMITVDYFSNFCEIDRLTSTKTSMIILKLKNHFARYGCPERVISDNGPQFSAEEFVTFADTWNFEHLTSSPGNSKANGKAESAVKMAKRLIRKAVEGGADPYLAILDYRNTPTQGMESSPAQRLLNRRTRTLLPTTSKLLQPKVMCQEKEFRDMKKRQEQQIKYYNRNAKDLPELSHGDVVRMKPFRMGKKKWDKAVVTARLDERSYTVKTPEGNSYRRNRSHLKKSAEMPIKEEVSSEDEWSQANEESTEEEVTQSTTPLKEKPTESLSPAKSPRPVAAEQDSQRQAACPVRITRPQRTRRAPEYLKDYVR
ncbi:uncharacterized protein K02A2.6-like [Dendronephthya gigantea]|uniref:uncharacterized protein K02A2.6-like n=1 Tax=Dendronephthya gigantea TaxID=151771 RepID=UPI001068D854|nr:uncharacterized protein K02A2.6-like [Dendronephthya gigantea]